MDMDVEYQLNQDEGKMQVILCVDLFKEEDKTIYPFSMSIKVIGDFSVSDTSNEAIEHYKPNTVAILFPYVRALIFSYTANANVSPLVLPPINVNRFLKAKQKNKI